jgi:Transposase DNA-binding/Transposase DDE domain
MRRVEGAAFQWAKGEFGDAALGDRRRRDRLLHIAATALERPDGRISEVFDEAGALHGAYDFVESPLVPASELTAAIGRSTARRCVGQPCVYVAVDGSSLTVTDRKRIKGFGMLGSGPQASRGLKVISALAVDAQGSTQGLLDQVWWTRPSGRKKTRVQRARLKLEQKETRHWVAAFEGAAARCAEAGVQPWFVVDREGDARDLLFSLLHLKALFTVRANWDRVVESRGADRAKLRAMLTKQRPLDVYELRVPAGHKRSARVARMELRSMRVTIRLCDKGTSKSDWVVLTAVWAREVGTTPQGEAPLDWLLYTNAPVPCIEHARRIVQGYSKRWRIEDFHRTWKSGQCNVERTQLHTPDAVVRWATILAAVATRIERLKHLARERADDPATIELTLEEIRMIVGLAATRKKRAERAPTEAMTIGAAVEWIARLGGYTGKSSGGPPGAITIARGLERLNDYVEGARIMRALDGG